MAPKYLAMIKKCAIKDERDGVIEGNTLDHLKGSLYDVAVAGALFVFRNLREVYDKNIEALKLATDRVRQEATQEKSKPEPRKTLTKEEAFQFLEQARKEVGYFFEIGGTLKDLELANFTSLCKLRDDELEKLSFVGICNWEWDIKKAWEQGLELEEKIA